jgi:tRNA pseudouridine32 synthase/23S rRNA pseudouridine746 synthase
MAITEFKVLKSATDRSLFEALPLTGRTHQIRVHLEALGHPIIGDNFYGDLSNSNNTESLHLLSFRLAFEHPITQEELVLELPEDQKPLWAI